MNENEEDRKDYFGFSLTITENVICNDGSKFEDYTWEEHLHYNGFCGNKCEICAQKN